MDFFYQIALLFYIQQYLSCPLTFFNLKVLYIYIYKFHCFSNLPVHLDSFLLLAHIHFSAFYFFKQFKTNFSTHHQIPFSVSAVSWVANSIVYSFL